MSGAALDKHGASDPVLPAVASGWARDLLVQGGAAVVSKNHGGGHDLGGPDVLQAIADFVRSSIPGAPCVDDEFCEVERGRWAEALAILRAGFSEVWMLVQTPIMGSARRCRRVRAAGSRHR